MNPTRTTTTDAQSINAAGRYRELIDGALSNVAELALDDGPRFDTFDDDEAERFATAAKTIRDRNSTVYGLMTVREAEALVAACQYALDGRYADRNATDEAIERVQYEAAAFDRGVRPEAHGLRGDDDEDGAPAEEGVDSGEGVRCDGGVVERSGGSDLLMGHERAGDDGTELGHGRLADSERVAPAARKAACAADRYGLDVRDVSPDTIVDGAADVTVPLPCAGLANAFEGTGYRVRGVLSATTTEVKVWIEPVDE